MHFHVAPLKPMQRDAHTPTMWRQNLSQGQTKNLRKRSHRSWRSVSTVVSAVAMGLLGRGSGHTEHLGGDKTAGISRHHTGTYHRPKRIQARLCDVNRVNQGWYKELKKKEEPSPIALAAILGKDSSSSRGTSVTPRIQGAAIGWWSDMSPFEERLLFSSQLVTRFSLEDQGLRPARSESF